MHTYTHQVIKSRLPLHNKRLQQHERKAIRFQTRCTIHIHYHFVGKRLQDKASHSVTKKFNSPPAAFSLNMKTGPGLDMACTYIHQVTKASRLPKTARLDLMNDSPHGRKGTGWDTHTYIHQVTMSYTIGDGRHVMHFRSIVYGYVLT